MRFKTFLRGILQVGYININSITSARQGSHSRRRDVLNFGDLVKQIEGNISLTTLSVPMAMHMFINPLLQMQRLSAMQKFCW